MTTTATVAQLERALAIINQKYAGNIRLNEVKPYRNGTRFTLRPLSSAGPGGARSGGYFGRGRKVHACCWHVHGDFFDALLSIEPGASVKSAKSTINIDGGNWQDFNVGPPVSPIMASECCECKVKS